MKVPSEKTVKKERSYSEQDDEYVVYLGDDKPIVIKPTEPKKSDKKVSFSRQTSEKGISSAISSSSVKTNKPIFIHRSR